MSDDIDIENGEIIIPKIVSDCEYLKLRRDLYQIVQHYSKDRDKTWDEIRKTPQSQKEDAIRGLFYKTLYLEAKDLFDEIRSSRRQQIRIPFTNFSFIDPYTLYKAKTFIKKEDKNNHD